MFRTRTIGLLAAALTASLAAGCGGDDSTTSAGDSSKDKPALTAADKRQAPQLVREALTAEIDQQPEQVCAALSPAGLKRLQASSTTSRFCKPLVTEAIEDPGNPDAGALISEHAGAMPGMVDPDVEAEEVSIVSSAQPEAAKQQLDDWNSQVTLAGQRLLVSFGNTPGKAIPLVKTAKGLKIDSLAAVPLPATFVAPSHKIVPCLQRGLGQRTTDLQREMERDDSLGKTAYYSFELGQDREGEGGGALTIKIPESEAIAKHVLASENSARGVVDAETGELSREVPDPLPAAAYGSLVASRTNDGADETDSPPEGQDLALIKKCGAAAGIAGM